MGSEYDKLRGYNDYSLGFGGPVPLLNTLMNIDDSFMNMTYWISGQSTSNENRSIYEMDSLAFIEGNLGNYQNQYLS